VTLERVKLYFLHFGLLEPLAGPDPRSRSMRGYLIQTDEGENILVDTGLPGYWGEDINAALERDGMANFVRPLEFGPEHTVPGQLALIGLTVDDIDLLLLTHSDLDHLGGIDFIPESVPILLSRVERELDVPAPTNPGYYDAWPERDYTLIEQEDQELRPGIKLLSTPGHTPGHFSLLVDLPRSGPILLAVDAIKMEDEIPNTGTNVDDAVASAQRVRDIAAQTGATLIHGHDGPQWTTLRQAPEVYE